MKKPTGDLLIVGASGYIGSCLYSRAKEAGPAIGTSSLGGNALLPFRLDAPTDFDYGQIHPGTVVLLTAAISSPDICRQDHDKAWAVNVTGTSKFIQCVIDCGARVIFFLVTRYLVSKSCLSMKQLTATLLANMPK